MGRPPLNWNCEKMPRTWEAVDLQGQPTPVQAVRRKTFGALSTARNATRPGLELLDAALDLVQTLVGALCGLVGGLGALRGALHPRVELVEARVDTRELVVVGGTGAKAQGGDDCHGERTGDREVRFGHGHFKSSFVIGLRNIAALWTAP